jgi:hypothetical protein
METGIRTDIEAKDADSAAGNPAILRLNLQFGASEHLHDQFFGRCLEMSRDIWRKPRAPDYPLSEGHIMHKPPIGCVGVIPLEPQFFCYERVYWLAYVIDSAMIS